MKSFSKKNIALFSIMVLISLIAALVISNICTVGRLPVYMPITGFDKKTYSHDEISSGMKDLVWSGSYIQSTSEDPWILLDSAGINGKFLSVRIKDLTEMSSSLQLFLFKDGSITSSQWYTIYQGENIIPIENTDCDTLRIDITNSPNYGFLIDEIAVSNNYFMLLPAGFWVVFILIFAVLVLISYAILYDKLSYKSGESSTGSLRQSEWYRNLVSSLTHHKKAFIAGSIIIFLVFGFEIFNFTLGVDEEREIVHSVGSKDNIETLSLREGRYVDYLFRTITDGDGTFTPFLNTLMAVLFLTASAVMLTICLERCYGKPFKNSTCIIFMGLYSTLPYVVTEWMCYSIMNASRAFFHFILALSLYTVSVYATSKRIEYDHKNTLVVILHRHKAMLISGGLAALAFLSGENSPPIFITISCFCVLLYVIGKEDSGFKDFFKRALYYIAAFIIGFAVYGIIRVSIGSNGYTGGYIKWGSADASEVIKNILKFIINIFNSTVPGSLLSLISIAVFALIILVIGIQSRNVQRFFMLVFGMVCCVIAAFSLNIIAGGSMPYRTMDPLMYLTSIPWIICIERLSGKKYIRYAPVLAAAVILLNQSIWVNKIFTGANLCAKLDTEMAYDIGTDIKTECSDSYESKPIVFVGRYQHSSPSIIKIDAVGQSVFYRSNYVTYLMRYLGFNFIRPSNEEMKAGKEYAAEMPVYPFDGYIQEFDDVIVVRVSEKG